MKKFGFTTVVASGLIAGVLGFAGPAQADIDHHDWVHQIQPTGERAAGRHQRAPEPLTTVGPTEGHPLRVPLFHVARTRSIAR